MLNFSSPNETVIKKVSINKTQDQYILNVVLEFFFKSPQALKGIMAQSVFILATTESGLNKKILQNSPLLAQYLKNTDSRRNRDTTVIKSDQTSAHALMVPFGDVFKNGPVYGNVNQEKLAYTREYQLIVNSQEVTSLLVSAGTVSLPNSGQNPRIRTVDHIVALEDEVVPSSNVVLYSDKEKNTVWLGGASQDNQGKWYAGISPSQSRDAPSSGLVSLYPAVVPNTKVVMSGQGAAALACQAPLNNLGQIFSTIFSGQNLRSPSPAAFRAGRTNYFSPLYPTKINSNFLCFAFAFNQNSCFMDSGLYSGLIKDKKALRSCFGIQSIKILRKRVTTDSPNNKLTNMFISKDFEDSYSGYKEVEIPANARSLQVEGTSPDILMFGVADPSIGGVTYGTYAYGVEFTIVDGTHKMIKSLAASLSQRLTSLSNMYTDASSALNYNIDSRSITAPYRRRLTSTPLNQRPEYNAVVTYMSAINVIYGAEAASILGDSIDSLSRKLYAETDVISNGPQGILTLMKLIQNFVSQLQQFLNISNDYKSYTGNSIKISNSRYGRQRRLITVRHYFDNFINAEDFDNNGYDYLATVQSDLKNTKYAPFRVVSYGQIDKIITAEEMKMNVALSAIPVDAASPRPGNSPATDTATAGGALTNVSLTPNYIKLGGTYHKINSQDPDQKSIQSFVATSLLAANSNKTSTKLPLSFNGINAAANKTDKAEITLATLKNNLNVIENGGCTIELERDQQKVKSAGLFYYLDAPLGLNTNEFIDAADKLSDASPFIVNKKDLKNPTTTTLLNYTLSDKSKDSAINSLDMISNLNESVLTYLTQTDYFKQSRTQGTLTKTPSVKNITDKKVFKSKSATPETVKQKELDNSRLNKTAQVDKIRTRLLNKGEGTEKPSLTLQDKTYVSSLGGKIVATDIADFSLKYGNTKKVECLVGMSIRRNKNVTASGRPSNYSGVSTWWPIWTQLTKQMIENYRAQGKTVLCRMVDPESDLSNYTGVSAPVYNDLFILGPAPVPVGIPSQPVSLLIDLNPTNFPQLTSMTSIQRAGSDYGRGFLEGTSQNLIRSKRGRSASPPTQNRDASPSTVAPGDVYYTNGKDFVLPNGDKYAGSYHLRRDANGALTAMVGPAHIKTSHAALTPVSNKALRQMAQRQGTNIASESSISPGPDRNQGSY
jgi:hypothetical protein